MAHKRDPTLHPQSTCPFFCSSAHHLILVYRIPDMITSSTYWLVKRSRVRRIRYEEVLPASQPASFSSVHQINTKDPGAPITKSRSQTNNTECWIATSLEYTIGREDNTEQSHNSHPRNTATLTRRKTGHKREPVNRRTLSPQSQNSTRPLKTRSRGISVGVCVGWWWGGIPNSQVSGHPVHHVSLKMLSGSLCWWRSILIPSPS